MRKKLIALLALASVGSDQSLLAQATRDSAGIRIHSSSAPIWGTSSRAWAVTGTPVLLLGTEDGPPELMFSRLKGVVKLKNGTIVAADGGSLSVRHFSKEGRHIVTVGRKGAGPGEISDLTMFWASTDSTTSVFDGRLNRIMTLNAGGKRMAEFYPRARSVFVGPLGNLNEDLYLVFYPLRGQLQAPPGTIIRDTITFAIWSAAGNAFTEIAQLPARPRIVFQHGQYTTYPFLPLTVEPVGAASRNRAYIARGIDPEVFVFDENGRLREIYRWSPVQRPLSNDQRRRFANQYIKERPKSEPAARAFTAAAPYPTREPLFDRLLVDPGENLWIQHHRIDPKDAVEYTVLSSRGAWLGNVQLPKGFSPSQIGLDYITGVTVDDLGVERVAILRLHR